MIKVSGVSYNIETGETIEGEISLWEAEDAMAKRIANYEVLVTVDKLIPSTSGVVRYHVDDDENPQIHIYDHFTLEIDPSGVFEDLLLDVENEIKTREDIE